MKKNYYDGVIKTVENMYARRSRGGSRPQEMTPDLKEAKEKYQQIAELHAKRDMILEAIATKREQLTWI